MQLFNIQFQQMILIPDVSKLTKLNETIGYIKYWMSYGEIYTVQFNREYPKFDFLLLLIFWLFKFVLLDQ